MKVCFYLADGLVFEPIQRAMREVFPDALRLGGEGAQKWKKALADSETVLIHLSGFEAMALVALGMAEALEKRVVLLCPSREVIPAPLGDRTVLVHGWNAEFLKEELQKLQEPGAASSRGGGSAADKFHNLFGDLLKQHGYEHKGAVELEGTVFTLRDQEMDLALVQAIANRARTLNLRVRLL